MKHFVKKDKNDVHKCIELCPFLKNGVKIGSGFCQSCEHHKNNNIIEDFGKDYDITKSGGYIDWIECDKLKESKNLVTCYCMACGEEFEGVEPKMCCSGYMCGCLGLPVDPVVCSEKCYNSFLFIKK